MIKVQTEISNSAIRIPNSELPAGWRWVKLEEVCEIDSSQVSPNTDLAKQLPYIGLEQIESGTGRFIEKINDSQGKLIQSTTFRFDSRHVLYGKLRPYLNKVATPHFEGRSTTELLPLLPNDGCDRYYLAWLLRREETVEEAMRHKTGTRMPRADMDELFKILVPVPCIEEQKRVATKIHELMQEVERARTACEKELEAAKALPSAHLRAVFESEESKKWERKKLRGVVKEFMSGGTPNTGIPQYWDGDIPWITGADVTNLWVSNGRKFITEEGLNNSATHLVKKNTVLIVTRTGVGKIGIAANDLCFSQDITGVFCNEKILPEFLVRYLLYQGDMLIRVQRGATIKGLTRDDIELLEVFMPPLPEQNRIVSYLKEKMAQLENLKSAIQNQQSALDALPQSILRKAFRVCDKK